MSRKITTEDFIAKARTIHGDKYDYSKTVYTKSTEKVYIICPEHGEFWQVPSSHLSGSGCPYCGKEKVKDVAISKMPTTQEFIEKLKIIYGDKYDFSKVSYKGNKIKVCIVCSKHGEFFKTPSELLRGQGCPRCNKSAKNITTEEFIERAKEVHGDKYDYSKTVYTKSTEKVCIIRPEHGEFWMQASRHIQGACCPKCWRSNANMTTNEFITKSKGIHNDKYDYSKVKYKDTKTPVSIICPIHGEFIQSPSLHLKGCGCKKCSSQRSASLRKLNIENFIERAKEIHGDKYDYSKVEYVNNQTKVCIICPEHGEFWQKPSKHLSGQGCKKCIAPNANMTTEEFIERAKEIHGDKYDYSKVKFEGIKNPICIICHEKDKFGREHGEFWQVAYNHLNGSGCCKCNGKYRMTTEEFIETAKHIHGDKYDYSKTIFTGVDNKVCIICPEHGEFWQIAYHHLNGIECPNCHGLRKDYKFNLLNEFIDEYHLKDFLMTNDVNIIYVILRNIEKIDPKFNPIVKDIDRVLNSDSTNPIGDLEDKYRTSDEIETMDSDVEEVTIVNIDNIDLDDDDAVDALINTTTTTVEKIEPTIEDLTRARETEINLINTIEHMLTPEDRQFIKDKFLNDKRRNWMLERDKK